MHGVVFVGVCACVRACVCAHVCVHVCVLLCVCVVCKCGVHFNGDHCLDMLLSLQHVCVCDDSVRHSKVATSYLHCLSVLLPSSYIASYLCDLLLSIRTGLCSVSLPGHAANTSSLDSRKYI